MVRPGGTYQWSSLRKRLMDLKASVLAAIGQLWDSHRCVERGFNANDSIMTVMVAWDKIVRLHPGLNVGFLFLLCCRRKLV